MAHHYASIGNDVAMYMCDSVTRPTSFLAINGDPAIFGKQRQVSSDVSSLSPGESEPSLRQEDSPPPHER
jgi:hypothetical protein